MEIKEICEIFLQRLGEIQNMSLNSDGSRLFAKCESFSIFYEKWIQVCQKNNIEQIDMLKLSLREYELSLILATSGLYKQAMESIRFSLEHAFFAILLSTNELYFRLWKSNEKDEVWAETIHAETGVFGSSFIKAFAPDLKEYGIELQTIARNIYRECSEYVHGNYNNIIQTSFEIEYSEKLYKMFMDKADSVAYLLTFVFAIRFWDKLNGEILLDLEPALMSYLSNIPEILALYE